MKYSCLNFKYTRPQSGQAGGGIKVRIADDSNIALDFNPR